MSLDSPISVGSVVQIADQVFRITAPNPGMMTGPGTNTYIVGKPGHYAVIDPGPLIASHIDAIREFVGADLREIIVTHTHMDHSPAAAELKKHAEVVSMGMLSEGELEAQFQDSSFVADRNLVDGDEIKIGDNRLRVLFTPGHVSNHLCFLLVGERLLFAGDHIMQGSTVAIVPPQGDMLHYLNSLQRLLDEDIEAIAPAHGLVITDPDDEISKLIAHRLWRENKVISKLSASKFISTVDLLRSVYDDVSIDLHWAAKFSLYAHLKKLCDEGRAVVSREVVLDSREAFEALDSVEWRLK